MILNDREIDTFNKDCGMITPSVSEQVREKNGNKVISYGLSSFGYDIRLASELKIPCNVTPHNEGIILDPKNPKLTAKI